ncbi:MAG: M48 family metallopeptidase [Burkholderiales bacterium]|nr:M48 family metallopeptidase [Burkholderiales bacterium]
MRPIALALSLALLPACAPVTQRPQVDERALAEETRKQRELALQDLLDDQARLFRVAWPILARGAPLCGERVRPALGARFASRADFAKEFREAAEKLLGVGEEPSVVQVAEGSPAQRAGLRERDVVVALDGRPAPRGEGAGRKLVEAIAEAAKAGRAPLLQVRRAGVEHTVAIAAEPVCDYPVVLHPADAINAFADGRQVAVMRGMLRFARDDLELAVVIGHELAHNSMKHIEKQTGNVLLGTILDILAAARGVNTQGAFGNLAGLVFSKEFEAEAELCRPVLRRARGLRRLARAQFLATHGGRLARRDRPPGLRRLAPLDARAVSRAREDRRGDPREAGRGPRARARAQAVAPPGRPPGPQTEGGAARASRRVQRPDST